MTWSLWFFLPLLSVLLLSSQISYAQDYDPEDDPDYGGGEGEDEEDYGDEGGGGGGEGGGELQKLESVEDFDKFLDNADASVIGAFVAEKIFDPKAVRPKDWDDEEDGEWEAPTIEDPALTNLKAVQSSVYSYRFAYTTAKEVLDRLKAKTGGLYLYRSPWYVSKEHGDRARERFPGTGEKLTEAAVSHWLDSKAQPLVGEYTSNAQDRYKGAVLIIFMNLDFKENTKSVSYVLKRARKVAVGLKGKLAIAVASLSTMSYELSDYGLESERDSDILMAIRAKGPGAESAAQRYGAPTDKSFSGDTLSAFANAYLAGELSPYKRPEGEDDKFDGGDDEGDSGGGKANEDL